MATILTFFNIVLYAQKIYLYQILTLIFLILVAAMVFITTKDRRRVEITFSFT